MKQQPLRLWCSLSLRSQLQLTLLICYIDVYALLCRHLEGFNRASNLSLCASLMCPSCISVSRSVRSAAAVVEISMQPVVKITIATNFSAHLHRCVYSLLQVLWRFQQNLQTLSMCIFDVCFPHSTDWHICESKEQPVKLMHCPQDYDGNSLCKSHDLSIPIWILWWDRMPPQEPDTVLKVLFRWMFQVEVRRWGEAKHGTV